MAAGYAAAQRPVLVHREHRLMADGAAGDADFVEAGKEVFRRGWHGAFIPASAI